MDKFHAPQHMREVCRTRYNPVWAPNAKIRKRLGCTVTVAAEHVFRFCNRRVAALKIGCYLVSLPFSAKLNVIRGLVALTHTHESET